MCHVPTGLSVSRAFKGADILTKPLPSTASATTPLRAGHRHSSPPHCLVASRRSSSPCRIPIARARTTTSDFLRPLTSSQVTVDTTASPPSSSDTSTDHRHCRSDLPQISLVCYSTSSPSVPLPSTRRRRGPPPCIVLSPCRLHVGVVAAMLKAVVSHGPASMPHEGECRS
jgi:hypothetical protein